jgi:hypothetical protein
MMKFVCLIVITTASFASGSTLTLFPGQTLAVPSGTRYATCLPGNGISPEIPICECENDFGSVVGYATGDNIPSQCARIRAKPDNCKTIRAAVVCDCADSFQYIRGQVVGGNSVFQCLSVHSDTRPRNCK